MDDDGLLTLCDHASKTSCRVELQLNLMQPFTCDMSVSTWASDS